MNRYTDRLTDIYQSLIPDTAAPLKKMSTTGKLLCLQSFERNFMFAGQAKLRAVMKPKIDITKKQDSYTGLTKYYSKYVLHLLKRA